MKNIVLLLAAVATVAAASTSSAGTLTFEGAPEGVDLGSYYQGITFGTGVQAIDQMLPYFPAHSGTEEISGSGTANTISFDFTSPQSQFSLFYVSYLGFVGTAYAANGTVVGTFGGIGNYNVNAVAGSPSTYSVNAQTGVTNGVADISSVVLTATAGSSAFTFVDDLSAPGLNGTVSAPDNSSTLLLLTVSGIGFAFLRRRPTPKANS